MYRLISPFLVTPSIHILCMYVTGTAHKSNALHGNTPMAWTMPGPTYPAVNSFGFVQCFTNFHHNILLLPSPSLLLLLLLLEKGTDNDSIDNNDDNVNDK